MIASTITIAGHLITTSFKILHSVLPVLDYVLPNFKMGGNKINVNTKHLTKGDPLPPFNGKLRVYNMRYCPYAQRTILALNAKGVDYEVVNIDLMNKPEWLTSKSQFGKVPALEIKEDLTIYESLVTVEYLDDVYPERPLLSKDPVKRAFDKIIIEAVGPIQTLFYQSIRNPDAVTDASYAAFDKALNFVQEQLKKRGTKFLGGDQPGFADYMIWPWFERIILVEDPKVTIDKEKFAPLLKYVDEMFKDPAVSQYLVPADVMKTFIDSYRKGLPTNYDLLLQE